jgi:hypothetical protein
VLISLKGKRGKLHMPWATGFPSSRGAPFLALLLGYFSMKIRVNS